MNGHASVNAGKAGKASDNIKRASKTPKERSGHDHDGEHFKEEDERMFKVNPCRRAGSHRSPGRRLRAFGPCRKAHGAMQMLARAPQKRSTATALAVARSGKHNARMREESSHFRQRRVPPNPSLKRSANGRPPGPGRWHSVHFHRPGPGVLPSSPA